jgi:hypothetical protein
LGAGIYRASGMQATARNCRSGSLRRDSGYCNHILRRHLHPKTRGTAFELTLRLPVRVHIHTRNGSQETI